MSEQARVDAVQKFIEAVVDAAIADVQVGIAEYDSRYNTGDRLLKRLDLKRYRIAWCNGDGKYARSVYTAAHWLYTTEEQPK